MTFEESLFVVPVLLTAVVVCIGNMTRIREWLNGEHAIMRPPVLPRPRPWVAPPPPPPRPTTAPTYRNAPPAQGWHARSATPEERGWGDDVVVTITAPDGSQRRMGLTREQACAFGVGVIQCATKAPT